MFVNYCEFLRIFARNYSVNHHKTLIDNRTIMGKICSVKSCPSGRKIKSNPSNTPKSLSFFKPTTPAKLEIWRKSLGIELKPKNHICHLHFKEKDIKMYEKFYINGVLKILLTGKIVLKQEAVPTIEHQFIPIPDDQLQASLIDPLLEQSSSFNHSADDKQDEEHAHGKPEELFVHQEMNSDAILSNEQANQSFEESLVIDEAQDVLIKYPETETVSQSINNIPNSINILSILPPLWLYLKRTDEVEFMRIDSTSKKVVNHICLNKDLSITVIFPNSDELHLKDKISSLNEITDYLKFVERWPICVGTLIDGNRFSKICRGVIVGEDAYKRTQLYPRCKACRILRNCLQNCHSKSTILEKTSAQKRHGENLSKQCKRLKRMKINLKNKLVLAKAQCAKKSEAFVREAINKLPLEIQNAILDFLQFLGDWKKLERKIPVSKSTLVGLKVTLRATLEILDMLHNQCNYQYLMTATLSQDPLERFFSIMRYSCGGNDHPDPKMFAQVYRLASCFSLIRPPKGCNVSGTDLLKNLMEAKDVFDSTINNRELWIEKIDNMLETIEPWNGDSSKDDDHDYNEAVTSDAVQSYIAGYIVRKLRKPVKCSNCLHTLQMNPNDGKQLQRNDVVNKMNLYGGLLYASHELFALTEQLEKFVLRAVSKSLTNVNNL